MIQETVMQAEELLQRISNHPGLRERVEEILDIAENRGGRAETADEAEELAIEAVRRLGRELMGEWSSRRARELNAPYERRLDVEKDGKKNSTGIPVLGRLKYRNKVSGRESRDNA